MIAQAVSWIEEQREKFLPSSRPLIAEQKAHLQPFVSAKTLDRLRIVEASKMGEKIPYPPFYEKVRAGGSRVVPDAAHMTAIPFIDVAEPPHGLSHLGPRSAVLRRGSERRDQGLL